MWSDWVRMQTLDWLQGHFISSLLSRCTFTIVSSILKQCRVHAENASELQGAFQCFPISDKMPWGGAPACPACNKTVYPMEQAIAADRKPFHAGCIRCQMKGCGWVGWGEARPEYFIISISIISNDLTARSLHKYEGYNICEKCHEMIFIQKVRETQRCEMWEMRYVRYEFEMCYVW